ncbi:MAG TPA: hypothetical protein VN515_03630 [Terriglobales bacterium]|nr:hypothetical protein [Terriglobales bacterium]
MKPALLSGLALGLLTMAAAQRPSGGAAMAADPNVHQVIVTAVPRHSGEMEPLEQGAVLVKQGGKDDTIHNWRPVDAHTAVDLAIIIDEDTQNLGVRLDDVRNFVKTLPPNVRVGVGYMSVGGIVFAQSAFTPDRNLILLKLRPPSGAPGSSPSPFTSIQYLMQRWRPHPGQVHEMLMISDGVEHLGGNDSNNITLKKAVAETVQAGVVVYAIAASGASDAGVSQNGSPMRDPIGGAGPGIIPGIGAESDSRGIINLGELTEATGGTTYAGNNGTAPRFTTFLNDMLQRLNHQYLLVFDSSKAKAGLESVNIEVHAPDENVTAPKQIFIAK